jgi:sec-independent protein translocase protein TatA
MGSMSLIHWLIVLGIALLLFGNRLPSLGKSLGEGIRNFKGGLNGDDNPDAQGKGPTDVSKQITGQSDTSSKSQETNHHKNG